MTNHRNNPYFEASTALELKELLSEFTDEELKSMKFGISLRDGCCGDKMYVSMDAIRVFAVDKTQFQLEILSEEEIAGYRTCIQSGGTIKRDQDWLKAYRGDKE